jgi:hypothetical protein
MKLTRMTSMGQANHEENDLPFIDADTAATPAASDGTPSEEEISIAGDDAQRNEPSFKRAASCHSNDLDDDFGSYSTPTSSCGNPSSTTSKKRVGSTSSPRNQLAANETRAVHRLKFVVFSFLFMSMMAVALTAYFLTAKQEDDEFHDQYYEDAHKILATIESNLKRTLQASDAYVTTLTSFAEATNQVWPYVVIPSFAVEAEKIRSLAKAVYVNTFHLVQPDERKDWEKFTAQTGMVWMNESIKAIEEYEGMDWPIIWNYTTWDVIWDYSELEKENPGVEGVTYDGPFLPFWQVQPAIPSEPLYNW